MLQHCSLGPKIIAQTDPKFGQNDEIDLHNIGLALWLCTYLRTVWVFLPVRTTGGEGGAARAGGWAATHGRRCLGWSRGGAGWRGGNVKGGRGQPLSELHICQTQCSSHFGKVSGKRKEEIDPLTQPIPHTPLKITSSELTLESLRWSLWSCPLFSPKQIRLAHNLWYRIE